MKNKQAAEVLRPYAESQNPEYNKLFRDACAVAVKELSRKRVKKQEVGK